MRRTVYVALNEIDTGGLDALPRDLVGIGGFGNGTFDFLIGARHDREATLEVNLVPVVGRRIVRRGDLDGRRRTRMPDGERHHRRRDRSEHQYDGKSLCGKDFGRGERELLGAVPGVTADDDM